MVLLESCTALALFRLLLLADQSTIVIIKMEVSILTIARDTRGVYTLSVF